MLLDFWLCDGLGADTDALSFKLQCCCERHGIEQSHWHDALADADATARLWLSILSKRRPTAEGQAQAATDADLVCREAFGPVAVLSRFEDFDAALAEINASAYGLQAGIFTRDLYKAQRAVITGHALLEVEGIVQSRDGVVTLRAQSCNDLSRHTQLVWGDKHQFAVEMFVNFNT